MRDWFGRDEVCWVSGNEGVFVLRCTKGHRHTVKERERERYRPHVVLVKTTRSAVLDRLEDVGDISEQKNAPFKPTPALNDARWRVDYATSCPRKTVARAEYLTLVLFISVIVMQSTL